MATILNQPVSFRVIKIEEHEKEEHARITVQFNNSTEYDTYTRKYFKEDALINSVIIDGCKVKFSFRYTHVYDIIRVYDTAGVKKLKSNSSKKNGKINKEEISKVVKELEDKLEGNPWNVQEATPEVAGETEEQAVVVNLMEVVEANQEALECKDSIEENSEEVDNYEWPVQHNKYNDIKACMEVNIPVYLVGPAGSGKNFTIEQIAEELGWNFYFSNSIQQEYKLTGFIDAGGKYHETEFYKACTDENDCIFFLDEIDASIPEVLVLLNAAIANGYFEFPMGKVTLDKVHFIAAGNTVGNGADDMYTGRMVIDQATLDRFAIIEFDYDTEIELHLTKGNKELVEFIHQLREDSQSKGIRVTFSYRCMMMVTKLESTGMEIVKIIKMAVVKGLDKDTINTLQANGYSKYHVALNNLKVAA